MLGFMFAGYPGSSRKSSEINEARLLCEVVSQRDEDSWGDPPSLRSYGGRPEAMAGRPAYAQRLRRGGPAFAVHLRLSAFICVLSFSLHLRPGRIADHRPRDHGTFGNAETLIAWNGTVKSLNGDWLNKVKIQYVSRGLGDVGYGGGVYLPPWSRDTVTSQ